MNTSATETIDDFLTNENTLVTDLLKDYNKLVGPVSVMDRSNNQTVEKLQVNITVVYAKLIELVEFTFHFTVITEFRMKQRAQLHLILPSLSNIEMPVSNGIPRSITAYNWFS